MNKFYLQRSHYNYFLEREDGVVGYNARKGTFLLLDQQVGGILRSNDPISDQSFDMQTINGLLDAGFVHSGNELDEVVSTFKIAKHQVDSYNFTIAPTLACNFSCDYCYQGDHANGTSMSRETQIASVHFIRNFIEVEHPKSITITWYGGEPLLGIKIILDMSEEITQIAKANEVSLSMNIVTNGILLNSSTAKMLAESGVSNAQISIDSLVFKASSKRGVIDASGKPSIILKNIISAKQYLDINIRINASVHNRTELPQIIEVLSENSLSTSFYIARITDDIAKVESLRETTLESNKSCGAGNCTSCESTGGTKSHMNTIALSDFSQIEQKTSLSSKSVQKLQQIAKKLTPKKHFCGATLGSMFVIDPSGYISRCWNSVGSPSEAIGNVLVDEGNSIEASQVNRFWDDFSPFAYHDCFTCKVLPLCMGGLDYP